MASAEFWFFFIAVDQRGPESARERPGFMYINIPNKTPSTYSTIASTGARPTLYKRKHLNLTLVQS